LVLALVVVVSCVLSAETAEGSCVHVCRVFPWRDLGLPPQNPGPPPRSTCPPLPANSGRPVRVLISPPSVLPEVMPFPFPPVDWTFWFYAFSRFPVLFPDLCAQVHLFLNKRMEARVPYILLRRFFSLCPPSPLPQFSEPHSFFPRNPQLFSFL